MRDVVICNAKRTPIGRFGGVFQSLSAADLGAAVVKSVVEESSIPPELIEEVIFANCYPTMDAPAIGRVIALNAGLPITTGGIQIDRRCGSGLQSIIYAVMQVASGGSDVVIAGGTESMSNAPFYTSQGRWGVTSPSGILLHDSLARGRVTAGGENFPVPGGMLETAENLRRDYGITREAQDQLALQSQQKYGAAVSTNKFGKEIVPIAIKRKRETVSIGEDEHPRPETTLETLAKLKPILSKSDPVATVTAGNASGQNDGAAACIVTTRQIAEQHGLNCQLKMNAWALSGVEPSRMGIGPVSASKAALNRAQLKLSDIDLIELNEAFAAQVLACTQEWNFSKEDFERMNVNGSGIALGHPVGATGARILATLAHELDRRDAQYGLETMCIGGGQGLAAVFERVTS